MAHKRACSYRFPIFAFLRSGELLQLPMRSKMEDGATQVRFINQNKFPQRFRVKRQWSMDKQMIIWFRVGKTEYANVGIKKGVWVEKLKSILSKSFFPRYFPKKTLNLFKELGDYKLVWTRKVRGWGRRGITRRPRKKLRRRGSRAWSPDKMEKDGGA